VLNVHRSKRGNVPYLLYAMKMHPCWEAASRSASKGIPKILRNLKVHYRVQKSHLSVPIRRQMNTVRIIPFYNSKVYSNLNSHRRLVLPTGIVLSGLPTKIISVFLISSCVPYSLHISASFILLL
jgi:hypothetical protein